MKTEGIKNISLGEDGIYTNATGVKQMLRFYYTCLNFTNCTILIDLSNVSWLDGNMCALLGALLHRLRQDKNIVFKMDGKQVVSSCEILLHNDFLKVAQGDGVLKKKSPIPFKYFSPKDVTGFMTYMENDLLKHTSMPSLKTDVKDKLLDDLGEVFGNIDKHAQTEQPFFVCGQYYPKQHVIRFSICDMGIGFFTNIHRLVPDKVDNAGRAILWALDGNSTKSDAPGGTGLSGLKRYMEDGNGHLQIFTNDYGWCSKTAAGNSLIYPDGTIPLGYKYDGAFINLEFSKKALSL